MAAYNVMTLEYPDARKGPEGLLAPRKMAVLQTQFLDMQIDVVGIQESRCPKEALITTSYP